MEINSKQGASPNKSLASEKEERIQSPHSEMPPPYHSRNDDYQYSHPDNYVALSSHDNTGAGMFCGCGGGRDYDTKQFTAYNKPISKNSSVKDRDFLDRNIQISPNPEPSPGCNISMSMDNNTVHCPFEDFC